MYDQNFIVPTSKNVKKKPNIIIIGMARSGTSMTAGIFARKGFYIGENLSANEHNPFGYFEPLELIELNANILRKAGHPHHNTWRLSPVSLETEKTLRSFSPDENCKKYFSKCLENGPFVWKDVRLCYTFPVWAKLFLNKDVRCILISRDPRSTYNSLKRTKWVGSEVDVKYIKELRDRHLNHARRALDDSKLPWLEISYEDYFTSPSEVASRLQDFVGIPFTKKDLNIHRNLNHNTFRGRALDFTRRQINRPGVQYLKKITKAIVPKKVVTWAFQEKKILKENCDNSNHESAG